MCDPQVRFCERPGGESPRAYSTAAGEIGAAGGAQRRAAGSPPAAQPRGRGFRAWLEALWRRMFGGE